MKYVGADSIGVSFNGGSEGHVNTTTGLVESYHRIQSGARTLFVTVTEFTITSLSSCPKPNKMGQMEEWEVQAPISRPIKGQLQITHYTNWPEQNILWAVAEKIRGKEQEAVVTVQRDLWWWCRVDVFRLIRMFIGPSNSPVKCYMNPLTLQFNELQHCPPHYYRPPDHRIALSPDQHECPLDWKQVTTRDLTDWKRPAATESQ